MNDLMNLLYQWHLLEPNWAKYGIEAIPGKEEYEKGAWAHEGKLVLIPVMEAINAHGYWLINLSSDYEDGELIYLGEVKRGGIEGAKWYSGEPSTNASEALLSAYLQALEATKTEEVAG